MAAPIVEIGFEPQRLLVLLALAFFLGLAFEEHFARSSRLNPPGGVRTFPLLALAGGLLYALEPHYGLLLAAGLLILGGWLTIYYLKRLDLPPDDDKSSDEESARDGGIVAMVSNLLAFLLGPISLAAPLWVPVSIAVTAVLLTGARERLHSFAASLRSEELVALGKFLIVIGVVLPLVPDKPVTSLTDITPYQVWLAVVTVSTLSYVSYLIQRFLAPNHGVLIAGFFGGLYSSTATTVVLSRRMRDQKFASGRAQGAIVLATSVMFLRILVVVGVLNIDLAMRLIVPMISLCLFGLALTAILLWSARNEKDDVADVLPKNPLELSTALIFAVLFILLSLALTWAGTHSLGQTGLYGLAALSGVVDVDPFVLNIATSQGTGHMGWITAIPAILIAASTNNVLKAIYTMIFSGGNSGWKPSLSLGLLAIGGFATALLLHFVSGAPNPS